MQRRRRVLNNRHSARDSTILFSDEKIFTVAQSVNKQNDRVYATNIEEANEKGRIIGRRQSDQSVMVWLGICEDGKTELVFIPAGVKINTDIYVTSILEKVVEPFAQQHFNGRPWIYQQDSAPSHRSKRTQDWCRLHFPDFLSSSKWPPYSPDLNPLDYAVWGKLEAEACAIRHPNIDSLKAALLQAHTNLSPEFLRAACQSFKTRLRLCIRAKGDYFE